jgi:hypothetical protein
MGGSPNDGVNVVVGTSAPSVAVEMAFRQITTHHSELCTEKNKMKIFKGPSNSKNMVFNVKKL